MARKRARRGESFAEIVAAVKASPSAKTAATAGLGRDGLWANRCGTQFECVTDELIPAAASELVRAGAEVVFDPCGCGGLACPTPLHWLDPASLERLGAAPAPVLHPSKDGAAGLEHWRSELGSSLVVAVNEITWGDEISG